MLLVGKIAGKHRKTRGILGKENQHFCIFVLKKRFVIFSSKTVEKETRGLRLFGSCQVPSAQRRPRRTENFWGQFCGGGFGWSLSY